MIRNYYTLAKLCEELQMLRNMKIIECFTQDKNSLILALYNNEDVYHLNFNADARLGALYLRDNFHRANRNSLDLFDSLPGQTIQAIKLEENDRIITVSTNDYNIYIVLFGGSKNNFIVTDKNNIIKDSFKSSQKLKGNLFGIETGSNQKENAGLSLFDYLAKGKHNFGKFYAREFILRHNLKPDMPYSEPDDLPDMIEDFKSGLLSSKEYYLLSETNDSPFFSLIPLMQTETLETFTSVSKGIERRIRKELIEGNIYAERKKMLRILTQLKSRIEKSISEISNSRDKLQRAEDYRHWAELLLQHKEQKSKPGDNVSLIDWDGNTIIIKINPDKTINENAQRYFEKAKNTESNIKIRSKMLPSLKEKLDTINLIIEQTENTVHVKKLKKIKEEYAALFGEDNQDRQGGNRFRTFDLGEGYMLYVGKNAANNDELTLHFAKPNDLWFHARGTSGSHAVLRMHKPEKPPKYILKKAAAVAAYYSGAKNAKYVPVSYTFKKFVHKPKGANPGAVVIKREEVIMAEPRLPDTDSENQ